MTFAKHSESFLYCHELVIPIERGEPRSFNSSLIGDNDMIASGRERWHLIPP